ncbi:MAG: hypothetical protein IKW21_02910 [Lachnospiraceae bacterium]|nr:hypothetical protein [Lachnospiraceae bacterium]
MTKEALKIISDDMEALGITYGFMGEGLEEDEDGNPIYPYYVGEYQEIEPMYENGQRESHFILTGYSRTSWDVLENDKEKLERYYPCDSGRIVITESGSAVAIFYLYSTPVRTTDAELKKIQINLDVKEWRVK